MKNPFRKRNPGCESCKHFVAEFYGENIGVVGYCNIYDEPGSTYEYARPQHNVNRRCRDFEAKEGK